MSIFKNKIFCIIIIVALCLICLFSGFLIGYNDAINSGAGDIGYKLECKKAEAQGRTLSYDDYKDYAKNLEEYAKKFKDISDSVIEQGTNDAGQIVE